MKLSIIVPVYNMAADGKLNFCLDSLVKQKQWIKENHMSENNPSLDFGDHERQLTDYEIICVDDCSTDSSVKILQEYQDRYPDQIKVICHETNRKQGGARNTGLKAACGEWVGFMDSDDWADPFMFSRLLQKAEETGADVVGCDYQLVQSHTFEPGEYIANSLDCQTGILGSDQRKSLCINHGSMVVKIYKRQVIVDKKLSFPENMFYEDNAAAPIWMCSFSHFERVAKPLYYYYQHETSTVHGISKEKLRDRIKAGELLITQAMERNLWQECSEELTHQYIHLSYCNTLFSYAQNCQATSKKMENAFLWELHARIVKMLADLQRRKDISKELEDSACDEAKVKKLRKEVGLHKKVNQKDMHYAYISLITNRYYQDFFDKEQKKFLEMFLQSPIKMKYYYELLYWYRKLRYGRTIGKKGRP